MEAALVEVLKKLQVVTICLLGCTGVWSVYGSIHTALFLFQTLMHSLLNVCQSIVNLFVYRGDDASQEAELSSALSHRWWCGEGGNLPEVQADRYRSFKLIQKAQKPLQSVILCTAELSLYGTSVKRSYWIGCLTVLVWAFSRLWFNRLSLLRYRM